ncbi:MAG: mechanosensitive ion channel domain-containing protein [Chloroflexota bacterium]
MWVWFTDNSVWFLFAAGVVLTVLLFSRDRLADSLARALLKRWTDRAGRITNRVLISVEGISLGVILVAMVAVILSREGVHNLITPETIQKWFLEQGTSVLITLVAGLGIWVAYQKFLPPLVRRLMVRTKGESKEGVKKRQETLLVVFMGTGRVLIVLLVIFMALSELNVPVGPMLAGLGVVGIAVGFGAQFLIRDLIAGVFVIMENQYRVGDVAKVADVAGLVEAVNLRKTVLRDLDGIVHHVPNGEIRVASNYSRHFARVNFNIPVAYGTDLSYAIGVINRVGQELAEDETWGRLLFSTPQVLRVDGFGDSGIDLKVLGDVKPLQQWAVMGELRLRLKKAFDDANIEIPWPHVKLYFGDAPPGQGPVCPNCSRANLPGSQFCSSCGTRFSHP